LRAAESGSPEERRVVLEISDDGKGEPAEIRSRVFEPYLPGKAGGKALGLGLSLVHGIVKRIGGEISVTYSEAGGATFLVTIPARPQPAPAAALQPAVLVEGGENRGTGQSILLAEDDEGLRTLAARVLAREGYVVLAARDGQEAVELFERNVTDVRLALLDDVMPRMGGRAALLRMRSLVPGLPAILCTGYTWSLDGKAQETGESFEVLPKPWRPRDLLRLVREELEPRSE
jgi:two-component system, cell cycle sensor histidine kinase and response regulator CckA